MKIKVYASIADTTAVEDKLSSDIFDFIRFTVNGRLYFRKPARKQVTVNHRKYTIKVTPDRVTSVLTPEGNDLYGKAIPQSWYGVETENIARAIVEDAYGED